MRRSDTRILTTHAGSLPRPAALTRLYARAGQGENATAEIAALGREALDQAIAQQRAAGIDIGNNGEQQRESFFLYMRHRLSGLGGAWDRPQRADLGRYPEFQRIFQAMFGAREAVGDSERMPTATGPVAYRDRALIDDECGDFRRALDAAPDRFVEAFMTAPSPGMIAAAIQNRHYDSEEAYLAALGTALKVEYEAIVAHGFLLQIDAPDLARERHATYFDRPLGEFLGFVERVVATINTALAMIPRDRVRLHVCWGNYEGPHDCDVPLAEILPLLLRADVGGLVLPFANPRHGHEYRVLRRFPPADDQIVVAGVIDTCTNFVEHPEVVAERIEQVAEMLDDPRRVIAGTDCGFETSAGRGRVAAELVWAKLAALSAGARIASGKLHGMISP